MKVEEQRVRTVRLELSGGREVRAGLWPGSDGEPGEVVLRTSWPEEPLGGRREDSLRLPADALPDLRDALEVLLEREPGETR